MYLSIIIPVYNEEKRIPKTLLVMDEYLQRQNYDYEILVVNDGSKDNTAKIIKNFESMIKGLRLIDNKENKGKGGVVAQGMLEAKGNYRLFMDADNATTIDHFEKMMPFLERGGFDVVIGSRRVKGAKIAVHQPFHKELLGRLGNLYIQIMAVWGIADTQCGFKAFSARAAQEIFSRITIIHWGFDVEVLALARKLNYRIREIPVYWVNDPESKVSSKAYLQVLWETTKIRWNLLTNKYRLK